MSVQYLKLLYTVKPVRRQKYVAAAGRAAFSAKYILSRIFSKCWKIKIKFRKHYPHRLYDPLRLRAIMPEVLYFHILPLTDSLAYVRYGANKIFMVIRFYVAVKFTGNIVKGFSPDLGVCAAGHKLVYHRNHFLFCKRSAFKNYFAQRDRFTVIQH